MEVKVVKLSELAKLPKKSTDLSSGFDIYTLKDYTLNFLEVKMIETGLALQIPYGVDCQIRIRSSLALKGVIIPNSPATIDSDYRGEIKVLLLSLNEKPILIKKYTRIAQFVFCKLVSNINFRVVTSLSQTCRGTGGFGSSGCY